MALSSLADRKSWSSQVRDPWWQHWCLKQSYSLCCSLWWRSPEVERNVSCQLVLSWCPPLFSWHRILKCNVWLEPATFDVGSLTHWVLHSLILLCLVLDQTKQLPVWLRIGSCGKDQIMDTQTFPRCWRPNTKCGAAIERRAEPATHQSEEPHHTHHTTSASVWLDPSEDCCLHSWWTKTKATLRRPSQVWRQRDLHTFSVGQWRLLTWQLKINGPKSTCTRLDLQYVRSD